MLLTVPILTDPAYNNTKSYPLDHSIELSDQLGELFDSGKGYVISPSHSPTPRKIHWKWRRLRPLLTTLKRVSVCTAWFSLSSQNLSPTTQSMKWTSA